MGKWWSKKGQALRGLRLLLCAWLFSSAAAADEDSLVIAAPLLFPLYERNGGGVEEAIVIATLAECGLKPVIQLQPFGRHLESFLQDEAVEAAVTVISAPAGVPYSFIYSSYQNSVITLRDRTTKPEHLSDLAGMRVVSFPGAARILPGLGAVRGSFATYIEIANQDAHSRLIMAGRVDAVIADKLIFAAYTNILGAQAGQDGQAAGRFDVAALFPETQAHWIFKDAAVGARVHQCFHTIRANGILGQLLEERRRRFFGIYVK
ncbi:hypothetical protein [Gimibacter soli]|uniref:Solute-binding protein family 3/N-terminal domain-containing protein n=1 Tax=Gimibacter soli TaxID=3024400 RepID=A0AAE9XTD6_9PROT|nr:hypothetical protein [Gimibacter soli]WCL53900.1 hypothetical protein PH603_15285 [Gimibacter soli]